MKELAGYQFQCPALTEIILPDSIISLRQMPFSGASQVKSINVPINLTSIGQNVFAGLSRCETIICKQTTAPSALTTSWCWGPVYNSIGYQTRATGTNRVYIPKGATGYDSEGWQELTHTNYGFTFVEME